MIKLDVTKLLSGILVAQLPIPLPLFGTHFNTCVLLNGNWKIVTLTGY